MDKKIILSVLIVALIGIVAATYQINPTQDILNPLASVDTEDTPVSDVLTAPEESQQQAQAEAEAKAQQEAQAEAQAQQAQDEAKAQQEAQAEAESESQNTQPDSSQAGATTQSGIINSENPVVVTTTGDSNANGESQSSSADSGSSSSDNGANSGANTNTGSTAPSSGSSQQDSNNVPAAPSDEEMVDDGTSTVDDNTWSEIDSVIQRAKNYFTYDISADRESCSVNDEGWYNVKVYNSNTGEFEGTLFVDIASQSESNWYFIDKYGDMKGPDVDPNQ